MREGGVVGELLRWACVALFLGRAWQHLRWDAPYRALLWSQETMEGVIAVVVGMSWETYATSPEVAAAIATGVQVIGLFFVLCAVAAGCCSPTRRWTHFVLAAGALALTFLAYVTYRDRLYRIGEFAEYACQFTLPLLLVLWTRGAVSGALLGNLLRVAIACTFVGHGLYAVGLYPTPGDWVTMTMGLTGLGDAAAMTFLRIAGVLDFVVAAALFVGPVARSAALYAAVWGLLTAVARVAAFVRWDSFADTASQWVFETLVRLPHAALPLALFWLLRARAASAEPFPQVRTPSPSEFPQPKPIT